MKVERDAALQGSFKVAWAAHFKVGFCDGESVGGGGHQFEAFAGVGSYFPFRHEYAIALRCSTAYTATELVELRQTEPFSVLNDHDRGVGDIDPDLYDCCCHQDVGIVVGEEVHLMVFFCRFHFPMDEGRAVGREGVAHQFITFFKAFEVELFAFLNQRVDDVDLPPLSHFTTDSTVDLNGLVVLAQ